MTTAQQYYSILRCKTLDYQGTRTWLADLDIDQPVYDYLIDRVQHTGGFSYADWAYLLDNLRYIDQEKAALYFLARFNGCGFLDMSELVMGVIYDGDGICSLIDSDGSYITDEDGSLIDDNCELLEDFEFLQGAFEFLEGEFT